MTAGSRVAKLTAVLLATAAHAGLALVLVREEPVQIEGSTGAASVRLGTSFADMVEGVIQAERVSEAAPREQVAPTSTTSARPIKAARAQTADRLEPAPSPTALLPLKSERAIPAEAEPEQAAKAAEPAPKAAIQETNQKPAQQEVKRGNAERTAQAGAATNRKAGTSQSSGATGDIAETGNAAAMNYPGKVRACVLRRARANARGVGTATVAFSVTKGGRITDVYLQEKSGNTALDRAAEAAVRRVGRCPKPPAGARRSFTINISAR